MKGDQFLSDLEIIRLKDRYTGDPRDLPQVLKWAREVRIAQALLQNTLEGLTWVYVEGGEIGFELSEKGRREAEDLEGLQGLWPGLKGEVYGNQDS